MNHSSLEIAKSKPTAHWLNLGDMAETAGLSTTLSRNFEVSLSHKKQSLQQLPVEKPDLFVLSVKNYVQLLSLLDENKPSWISQVKTLVIVEELSIEILKCVTNFFDCIAIVPEIITERELQPIIESSFVVVKQQESTEDSLRKFKSQNRQLEVLTKDLEAIVRARTTDIEYSKNEIEKKVKKVKQLIGFIESLTSARRAEDLLLILQQEIDRTFPKAEAFVAAESTQYGAWILYTRRNEVTSMRPKQVWKRIQNIEVNDVENQKFMANAFGRPFSRVITFALQAKGMSSDNVVLFVEHQFSKQEIQPFVSFMQERLQSLSLALDRSLVEVEMKNASSLWESTFDSIDDPIAIIDHQLGVIRSNKAFSENINLEDGIAQLRSLKELQAVVSQCLLRASAVNQTFKIQQKFFDCHCYPIVFHSEEPVSSVVIHFVDVTNYKNLQSTMVQNEKMSAIGHLAGNIAHELNNPLTGIRSLSQVLMQEHRDHSQKQVLADLEEVEKAASRSQKIINNLLSFSTQSGGSSLEVVDLADLVENTLPLLKSVTSEHERHIDLGKQKILVRVDPHLTQQVIFNLINNSCQAMKTPGRLTIKVCRSQKTALFSVADTGPGVPSEIGGSIFDPFVTTKSNVGGTGLGLSMSRRVIEKMGGEIDFQSPQGEGAMFWFSLPLVEDGESE